MRAHATNAPTVELHPYLTFAVADEEYAIEVLRVREILAFVPLTKVPRAPQFVAGVMNLRGTVVPVIDLRVKLGLSATVVTPHTCIIIVEVVNENGGVVMGLLTDDVKQVIELGPDDVEPPPSFGTKIDLTYLLGMGDLGERFALILDIDRVLTALELIAAAGAAAEAEQGRA